MQKDKIIKVSSSNDEYMFDPYVGPKYGTEESVLMRRLLVLGASHYGVDADNHDGNLTLFWPVIPVSALPLEPHRSSHHFCTLSKFCLLALGVTFV